MQPTLTISPAAKLARARNMSVVCTLHQPNPETVASIDNLLVLALGQVVYSGPTEGGWAVGGGEETGRAGGGNVADHLLGEASRVTIARRENADACAVTGWDAFIEESRRVEAALKDAAPLSYPTSGGRQFSVLCKRFLQTAVQDPLVYGVRTAMIMFMAFVIGALYFQLDNNYESIGDLVSCYFFCTLVTTFVSLTALPSCIDDRIVLGHEYGNKMYRIGAYVAANLTTRFFVIAIIDLSFILVTFFMIGVGSSAVDQLAVVVAILLLANFLAEVLMVILGSLIPIAVAGIAIGVTVYGFFMLMSGAFIPPARMPVFMRPVTFLSYYKYVIESLMINSMSSMSFRCPDVLKDFLPDFAACRISGSSVLADEYDKGGPFFIPSVGVGIAVLAGFLFLAIVVYLIVLRRSLKRTIFRA